MLKVILLVFIIFGLNLNADSKELNMKISIVENGKNNIRVQKYSPNGKLELSIISKTNLSKGVFTLYYESGSLKEHRIID